MHSHQARLQAGAGFSGRRLNTPRAAPAVSGRQRSRITAFTTVPSEYKNVAPVGDRVLVKVDSEEQKTSSGLLLPTSAQKKPTQGEIIGAGTAKAVKNGDRVVYSKFAGTELKVQDDDLVLLKVVVCLQEDDVIGVLSSKDISQLKPLGDRILIQARADIHPSPHLYSIKSLSGMSEGTCMMLLRLKGPLHRQPPSSPLGQHLLWRPCYCVQVADAGDTSEGGILLTTGSKEQPTLGKVVAVGSGKGDEKGNIVKPNVEVNSTVIYSKYAGAEFEGDDDTQYIVVRESDILATLA
eukprot:jgi/Astpho2/2204/Aster-03192